MELAKAITMTILRPHTLCLLLTAMIGITVANTVYDAVDEALTVHETKVEDMTIRIANNY